MRDMHKGPGANLGNKPHDMCHTETCRETIQLAACVAHPPMNKGMADISKAL